jgi:hypothetical protein
LWLGNGDFHDASNNFSNRGRQSECGWNRYLAIWIAFDGSSAWNGGDAAAARTSHNGERT